MNINLYIKSNNFSNQLPAINNLLENAKGSVSFLGKRVIILKEEGAISLNEFALSVLRAGRQRSCADDLRTEERIAGLEIVSKLKKFYQVTDTLISNSNWFTRLLSTIRDHTYFYGPRFYAEEGRMEHYFRGYSENRLKNEFRDSKEFGSFNFRFGSFGPPVRTIVDESFIREKLVK